MNCYQKGFTIIELLTVMAIMGLVIGGVITIYIMGATAWKEGSVQVALQRGGSIAMEKMVRGVYGTNGIREAKHNTDSEPNNVTLHSGNTEIQYKSGIDNVTRRFYLSGSEIWYDSDTSPGGGDCIAENVTGLTFSPSLIDNMVTINLGMEGQVIDKTIKVDLSTEVKLRN